MKKIKIKNVLALGLGALALTGSTMALTSCSFSSLKDKIVDIFDGDKDKPVESSDTTPIVDGVETQEGDLSNIVFPKSIIHRSNATNNVMNLSVNIEPSYAVNQTLSWSLAWASSNSGNVNDYVSLSVGVNTHSATLTCKKAYTTQIILTVSTTDGSNLSQTCTLDYLSRNVSLSNDVDIALGVDLSNKPISTFLKDNTLSLSGGSLNGSIVIDSYKVCMAHELDSEAEKNADYNNFTFSNVNDTTTFVDMAKQKYQSANLSNYQALLNKWCGNSFMTITVNYHLTYGGSTYLSSSICDGYYEAFNFNSQLKITNISLSTGDVKF